jgi:CubicO group peptidase (beta-lactamase class C family)
MWHPRVGLRGEKLKPSYELFRSIVRTPIQLRGINMISFRQSTLSCVLVLGATGAVVSCHNGASTAPGRSVLDSDGRIARVARSLQQPLIVEGRPNPTWSVEERMENFSVPAVSVAVIDDGALAWSNAWGVIRHGADSEIDTEPIFLAGSVS